MCHRGRSVSSFFSSCSSWARFSFLAALVLGLSWDEPVLAQTSCPPPWLTAPSVVGVVSVTGTGSTTSGTLTQKTSQNATATVNMPVIGLQSCAFMAVRGQVGQIDSTANINDSVSDSSSGNVITWVGSGPGDYLGAQGTFGVITPTSYNFYVGDGTPGTITISGQPPANEDLVWGPSSGGATLLNVPMAAGSGMVWGSTSFQAPPFEQGQGAGLNANWTLDWLFTAVPDNDCEKCKQRDAPMKGSEISPQSQILGEEVALVGTPFFLHYESSRVPGYAGADLFAMKDALSLGGWTLSAHHVFDPLLSNYCADGTCTPYAVVPKAIFFGYGGSRSDADVQASVGLNGNFLISAEDGSQVYVFNGKGQHLQTLSPFTGAVIYTFAYDSSNRLTSVTDANGNVTSIQRNASGNPTSITGPFGAKTTLAVDANGFLSKITDPAGHATTLTNSAAGLLLTLTDPNAKKYTYTYDSTGLLTKHVDPAGGSITLARTNTATGYSVKNTTAVGRNSTYAVAFASGTGQTSQTETTTWPNGLVATGTHTMQTGQVSNSVTLPNGNSQAMTLGPDPRWGMQTPIVSSQSETLGNLTRTVTQTRTATLSDVTNPFSLTSQTDTLTVNGNVSTYVYTAATKSLVGKTPVGRTITTVLDSQDRVSTVQPTGLALTRLTYDAQGRVVSVAVGTRNTTFAFDTTGNLASTTNPLNQTRKFTYDAAGNVLTAQLEDGRIVNYGYDADGNLTSVTAPGGVAHTYGYSAVNLATTYTPPVVTGAGATTYAFNTDRDLTKVTRPDGGVVTYKYDTSGRVSSIVTPSATMTYAYNATTGNLTKAAVTGGESITYAYIGSLPTKATWAGTVAGAVTRTYNNNFLIASENVTGGSNIAFAYDKDGLQTKAGTLTMTRAANNGLYTGGTLGSTKDTYVYNTFAEPTTHTVLFGTTTLYSAKYTRDNLGRISALTETIGGTATTYAYTYDLAGRLASVKKGGTTVSTYTYDQNSNRSTAKTASGTVNGTYDAQDRLLTYGSTAYTYTSNGELASKSSGGQLTSYLYDVLGNLTGVTLPNGTVISYIIDPSNHRVGKKVNGVLTTGFLYDGDELVAQLNGSNQIVSQFVYGAHSGAPEYMISGGVTYRIFSDHLGSPRFVVNSTTGQIVEQIAYDEFGNVVSDTNPGFQPFGFAGGLYDVDTGLVRFGARDYDTVAGRWTSKDPIRFDAGGTNLYGYVLNDPVNRIDPAGLEDTCPCKKKVEEMAEKVGPRPEKPQDPVTAKGPKLSDTPNLDRLGITKIQGSGPPADTPNPLSFTRGGVTVSPFTIEGSFTTLGGTSGKAGVSLSLALSWGRTISVKDGGSMLKVPFPIKLDDFPIACYINF